MKKIFLVDPNKQYAEKVRHKLNLKLMPLATIETFILPDDLKLDFDLLIIHESFQNCSAIFANSDTVPKKPVILLTETKTTNQKPDKRELVRLSRQSSILDWQHLILLSLENSNYKVETEQNQLDLLFTFEQTKHRIFFQKWLMDQKSKGARIFILPLKPLYFWNYRAKFHQGPDFSDMILQIEQDVELSSKDLGVIFEKQPEGVFLPRPSGFSEDIFSYQTESILKICRLFRKFISAQERNSIGLIDIEARPFGLVKEIASLCNFCHIDLVEEKNFGSRKAKEEIAAFLAEKSPSVQFKPIDFSKTKVN